MRRPAWILLLILIHLLPGTAKPQKEPLITRYSELYHIGEQWFCPLCDQPVDNSDRSGIDPALLLSEWHDTFLDSAYFSSKINHISDDELLRSLRLPPATTALLANTPSNEAGPWLKRHFSRRPDNRRLYEYDARQNTPFVTIEEFLQAVQGDSSRRQAIIAAARTVADPDSGFMIGGLRFSNQVDLNADWPTVSEFGLHYCRFFTDLLSGYLVTSDSHFGQSFENLFNQWYAQRNSVQQKERGPNIKSRHVIWYELGLGNRLPRLIDSYRVYRSRLAPETHMRLLKTFLGSGRWLYECLHRTPFHPYNWQVQTAMTLAYLAVLFPEFTESDAWLQESRRNMALHFERDILADGGYVERTGSYTRYAFDMFYRYMRLFHLFHNDTEFFRRGLPQLEKMMEFTALTTAPTGVNCPFNDSRRGTDLAELLAEMGLFFNRPDFIAAAAPALDSTQIQALRIKPQNPVATSTLFPDSKFAVMRDSWHPNACFMLINYGPFANHGHYDILDFEAFANGVPIAVDAGIGSQGYSDPRHVEWYKHSRSHNMVTIDDAACAKRGISGRDVVWYAGEHIDYFGASHDGYLAYQNAVCHRRIAFVHSDYWLILDQVNTATPDKILDWNFHTPLSMRKRADGFISVDRPGAAILLPKADAEQIELLQQSGPADLNAIEAVGHRDIDWLILRRLSQADSSRDRFAVLIYPLKADTTAAVPLFEQVPEQDPAVLAYRVKTPTGTDLLLFSDGRPRSFSCGIEGDFHFAWLRMTDDRPQALAVVGATHINWPGIWQQAWPVRNDFETVF